MDEQDGGVPIRLPLACALRAGEQVEVVFRQPMTCAVLGFDMTDTALRFERFHLPAGKFVPYPRPHEKLYVVKGEHLVYRAADVVDCPGAADLAAGRPFQPKLPSFLDHLRAQRSPSIGRVAGGLQASSGAPAALSSASVLADEFDVSISSPARVLRSGLVLPPTPDSPSTRSAQRRASTSGQRINANAINGSVSAGGKRKRGEPSNMPRKQARTRGRSPEPGDSGEVWEIHDGDLLMLWVI